MSSPEVNLEAVQDQALKLSVDDRLALLQFIVESLESVPEHSNNPVVLDPIEVPVKGTASDKSQARRAASIRKMCGLLKTDQPALTDAEVQKLLEERRVEKYL